MTSPVAKVIRAGASLLRGRVSPESGPGGGGAVFVGNFLVIGGSSEATIGVVRSTLLPGHLGEDRPEEIEFDIEPLGRLVRQAEGGLRFSRGVIRMPAIGSPIFEADEAALAAVLPGKSTSRIGIGAIDPLQGREFTIDPDLLLRTHFAIFGATGSGKTSAVVALLRGLFDALPHAHAVIIDPHGEYKGCLGDKATTWDRHTLRLPYWLLRFRELAAIFKLAPEADFPGETKILREAVLDAKRQFAREGGMAPDARLSLDAPLPYRLSELRALVTKQMSGLKRDEPTASYVRVLNRLDELTQDERFAFMFSPGYVRDMLAEVIGQLLPDTSSRIGVSILDLSEIPDEAIDVIVASVARLLLSLANWASPEGGIPALLVCEESSRYMAASHEVEGRLAVETLAQVAREGRKYGVSLGISSQRASQLSAEIVSQCGTVFVLRTSNRHDLDFIARALPESASALVETVPALSTGEAIAFGQAAPFPIAFRITRLPEDAAPKPKAAGFSTAWGKPGPDPGVLARAIARWREHGHLFHR